MAQRIAEVRARYEVTPRITGSYARLPRPGTTYALDQPQFAPDRRFPGDLPNAPFPIETAFTAVIDILWHSVMTKLGKPQTGNVP